MVLLTNDPRSRDQRPLGGPRRAPADPMPQKDAPEPTFDKRWIDRVDQPTLRAQLNTLRERNALLGEAITPSEQLKQKTLELAVATEKDATLRDAARRGLDAFLLAQDRAAVAARVQLGIASDREMMAIRLRDIEEQIAKGFIRNEQEKALAMRLANKEIDEQVKALEVRRSQFPGLTRFGQEAADLRAGIDQFAVSTFNDANKALVDLQMNSGKAGEAWKRFVEQFNRGLLETINKRFILGRANAASGWLNNLFPAGHSIRRLTADGKMGFARGGIFDGPSCFRFANGGAGSFGHYGRGRAGSDRAAEAASERPARHRSYRRRRLSADHGQCDQCAGRHAGARAARSVEWRPRHRRADRRGGRQQSRHAWHARQSHAARHGRR